MKNFLLKLNGFFKRADLADGAWSGFCLVVLKPNRRVLIVVVVTG